MLAPKPQVSRLRNTRQPHPAEMLLISDPVPTTLAIAAQQPHAVASRGFARIVTLPISSAGLPDAEPQVMPSGARG